MPILSPYSCWNPYEKSWLQWLQHVESAKRSLRKQHVFLKHIFSKQTTCLLFLWQKVQCFYSDSAWPVLQLLNSASIHSWASKAPFLKWKNTANISIQPTSTNHVLPSWMYCHIDIISMYFVNYIQPTMYCHVLPCINIIYNIAINIAQLKLTNFSQFLPIP